MALELAGAIAGPPFGEGPGSVVGLVARYAHHSAAAMRGAAILKSYSTWTIRLEPKVYAVEGASGTAGEAIPCGSGKEPDITPRAMNDKMLRRKAAPIRSHQRADVACQSLKAKRTQARAPPQLRTKASQANGNSRGERMTGSFIAHHPTQS